MLDFRPADFNPNEETDFDTWRRRSGGVYVPKTKVDQWMGRKTTVQLAKSNSLLSDENDEKSVKEKIQNREAAKSQPSGEFLKMHSGSTVTAAKAILE